MAEEKKDDKKKDKKDKKGKENKEALGIEGGEEEDEGGILSVVLVTVVIVIIWLAILALLIKLDVGGFGSNIATPILKDIPGVNKVLPGYSLTASGNSAEESGSVGYDNLEDAVARIKELESELMMAEEGVNNSQQTIADLQSQISRLETFRDNQVAFEKIRDEYYNEVVFGDSAPSISEYRKYYEEINPTNAEILYKQVVQQEAADEKLEDYAKAYSSMKPKEAAGIFESEVMKGNIELSAKILGVMSADSRGNILGKMDPEIAGQITKVMEPEENLDTSYVDTGTLLGTNDLAKEEEKPANDNTVSDDTVSDNANAN
ncbi:MAG: hypothetical protein K6F99_01775 [Lachnospiraceae bacterium]|nr:hypothetical protein [Lachnospiraceae bacterium]